MVLALAILFGQIPLIDMSADANSGEQLIAQKVDAGYFDIWRHADGKTWTDSDGDGKRDMPGQEKIVNLYITIPQEYYDNYKDVRFEVTTEFGQSEYNAAGGYIDWENGGVKLNFSQYEKGIIKFKPENYYLISGKTVHLKLDGTYKELPPKPYSGKLVEGRRYYLPFIVKYYGVSKNPLPPIDNPNPPVVINPPRPTPPPVPEVNERPVASFTVSKMNPREYEQISFTNTSYHPNSPKESIVSYLWEIGQYNEIQGYYNVYKTTRDPGSIMWPKAGSFRVALTVTDQDGETDTYVERISVDEAIPVAVITAPKEVIVNREVNISGDKSYSSGFDEIIREKNKWEIYYPNGSLAWSGKQRYPKNEAPPNNLFNVVGNWKIRLMVEDEDGTQSEWVEEIVEVLPDNPPICEFILPENSVRFSVGNYEITAASNSRSAIPDRYFGEEIFKHAWNLYYDSDNNGSYETIIEPNKESVYAKLITTGENDKTPKIRAFRTGRFRLDLQVQERYFGWGTFRNGLTSKISKEFIVENLAPVGTFETEPIRNAEIVIVVDGTENQAERVLSIQNNLNKFRQQLLNNNIRATINIREEKPDKDPWPQWGKDNKRSFYSESDILPPYDVINLYAGSQYLSADQPVITRDGLFIQNGGRDRDINAYNLFDFTLSGKNKTPKKIWSFTTNGECNEPPVLSPDGDTVYQADRNGNLYALDVKTGSLKWSTGKGGGISHLAVDPEGDIYSFNERSVAKINKDGKRIWFKSEYNDGSYGKGYGIVDESNVYGISYSYYAHSDMANFWVKDKNTGETKWRFLEESIAFAVDENYVYLTSSETYSSPKYLRKFDKNTGELIKTYSVWGENIVVKDEFLYLTRPGHIYKINKNTGQAVWHKNTTGNLSYSRHSLVTNSKVYTTSLGRNPNYGSQGNYYLDIFDKKNGELEDSIYLSTTYLHGYQWMFTAPVSNDNGKVYVRTGSGSFVEIGNKNINGNLGSLNNLIKYNTWDDKNPYRIVVSVSDAGYSDISNIETVTAALNSKQANLFVIGRSAIIKDQAKEIHNLIEGDYIQGALDMSGPLTELGTKIINLINSKTSSVPFVVLVNEELNYITNYIDLEKDPKIDEYWHFTHDYGNIGSYTLSNGQGKNTTVDNKTVAAPFNIFSKPGNYKTKYYVKDQIPWSAYRNHLQAGNKWSIPPDRTIIVHRRPIASFITNKDTYKLRETIAYTDNSYDPDLQFTDPSGHKGISKKFWRYKNYNDTQWITSNYPPSSFNKPGTWYIGLKVQDVHGAYSDWFTQTVKVENQKPLAKFVPVPKKAGKGQDIILLDYSYDPDGNKIINWEYSVEELGTFRELSPTIRYNTIGTKTITLKVQDEHGAWSDPYNDTIEVLNQMNLPPVARFNPTPNPVAINQRVSYNESSYDPLGEKIVTRIWYVKEPDSGQEKIYNNTLPPTSYSVPGNYIISLEVEDESGLWSEKVVRTLTVLDPLKVIGDSNKKVYRAGEAMILSAQTSGGAYKVEAKMWWPWGNDFVNTNVTELVPLNQVGNPPIDINQWQSRHKVMENDYDVVVIIPRDMPDGEYFVEFIAYRRNPDGTIDKATDKIKVAVNGSQFNRIKTRIIR